MDRRQGQGNVLRLSDVDVEMSGDGGPGLRNDGCPPRRAPSLQRARRSVGWDETHADVELMTLVQLGLDGAESAFRNS